MVKKNWWTLMYHHKSWLKNVNHRDRSRRCGITSCRSLKKLSSERSYLVKMCQKLTSMFVRLTLAKKKPVKSSVEHQMCVQASRLWWHFRELVSLTITKSKGKIRGLESLGMICSLGELGISDSVVPKGIYRWHPNLAR